MTTAKILLAFCLFFISVASYSQQEGDSANLQGINVDRLSKIISDKSNRLTASIRRKSLKSLKRLERIETRLYKRQLTSADSLTARASLEEIPLRYSAIRRIVNGETSAPGALSYVPVLDTLQAMLRFLDQTKISGKVSGSVANAGILAQNFNAADRVNAFIEDRRQLLLQHVSEIARKSELLKISKEAYYYSARIREYRESLGDMKKIQKRAFELVRQTRLFKDFMKRNSQLASLFNMPANDAETSALVRVMGLQTRDQVNSLLQQQLSIGGAASSSQFNQNMQDAQSELQALKTKVEGLGAGSSDVAMPEGFRPNNQKSKSFFKRFELGTNMQSQKASYYFPVTTDLGLSVGYKLNDRSVIGIGGSYKLGLGKGWNNITVSHQGLGLRSFIDWKVKGSFWLSGGYEANYRNVINEISQLANRSSWQESALLGVSKVLSLKSSFFKKTRIQLLWDMLSYSQVPRTEPIVFRIGYNL